MIRFDPITVGWFAPANPPAVVGEIWYNIIMKNKNTLDEKNNLAAIDSFTRNKNKSWHWYLNDKKIDKPLGEIILKFGDKILIKYD